MHGSHWSLRAHAARPPPTADRTEPDQRERVCETFVRRAFQILPFARKDGRRHCFEKRSVILSHLKYEIERIRHDPHDELLKSSPFCSEPTTAVNLDAAAAAATASAAATTATAAEPTTAAEVDAATATATAENTAAAIQAQNQADEEAAAALAAEELRLRRRRLHAAAAMARLAQAAANDAVASAHAAAASAAQALVQFNEAQNAATGLTYMDSSRERLL